MATSGIVKTNAYDSRYIEFAWSRTSYSVENNTTTISWTLTARGTGKYGMYKASPFEVRIDNKQVYYYSASKTRISTYDGTLITSGTYTFTHNEDGAKSFAVSIKAGVYYTGEYNCTGSGTFQLDALPRASGVACSTAKIGTAPTITIAKASGDFTHTLKYEFYSLSGTIAEKTDADTYTAFVWPDTFYAEIPDAPSGTGTITCETYNGEVLLGTSTCPFTVNADKAASEPDISPTIEDTNETTLKLTGDKNVLVKYHSNASVTTGATARNCATLVNQTTTNSGKSLQGERCAFEGVESGVFSFAIEDSRGYVAESAVDLGAAGMFVEYIKPTCNINVGRMDGNGNITIVCKGNCFSGSFGAVDNELQVQYWYKTQDGEFGALTDMTVTYNGNSYTATANVTGLNYQEDYVFETVAKDKLEVAASASPVDKSIPVFHWGKDSFRFNVPVYDKDGKLLGTSYDTMYPVGTVLVRYDHISPASLYGGEWTRIEGAFLWGSTKTDTIGKTGGEAEVTLTVEQMPSHNHGLKRITSALASSSSGWARFDSNGTADDTVITNTGGGQAHNNMPPFVNVSVWRRTA